MLYKNRRERFVEKVEDINKIIEIADVCSILTKSEVQTDSKVNTSKFSFIKDNPKWFSITTRYVKEVVETDGAISYSPCLDNKYVCTWKFDKTACGCTVIDDKTIARITNNVYTPKDIVKSGEISFTVIESSAGNKIVESARPILGFGEKFNRKETFVYGYDLNSAYSSVLIDKIIDTYNYRLYGKVGKNEVGFMLDMDLTMVHKGYADIIFPLIDSPYRAFIEHWYHVKKVSPKGSKERAEAKAILNHMVGIWQNHNPFLRAYVVNSCNEKIKAIVDKYKEHCVYWNTDAVYSDIPLELTVGENIGEFKLEYEGRMRIVGLNYQKVDSEEVCYRGVSKCLFKKDFNILTDPIPVEGYPYRFDDMKKKIV